MAKKKIQLPVKLARIQELFVPDTFKAPTDVVVYEQQRQAFELDHGTGGGFSEIVDDYARHNKGKAEELSPQTDVSTALQKILSLNSLEEYRRMHGLDKIREKLLEALVEHASFDKGVDIVYDHLTSSKNAMRSEKKTSYLALDMLAEKEKTIDSKEQLIAMFYPDMTADELTWISLTVNKRAHWVFDEESFMYWPPSLIEMDLDGLLFAHGTIDDRDKESINPSDPHQIGGLTGIDDQVELFHFHPNVAQIVKALVLLNIDDSDLYDKLWGEQDVTAIRRGDQILLRSFIDPKKYGIAVEDMDNPLEDLLRNDSNLLDEAAIQQLRSEVAQFYHNSSINSPHVHSLLDFVKLIGTLDRVPSFVQAKTPFKGYARPYGTDMNFINEAGEIIDNVPLVSHLRNLVAYQFGGRITELNRKDQILRDLFKELVQRIVEKNIQQENQMSIDMLHEQLLDQGVFVSQQSYAQIEKIPMSEFLAGGITKYTSRDRIIITTKFSFDEMVDIKNLLEALPAELRQGVRTITKKTSPHPSMEVLLYGKETAGFYNPRTQAITLSLPVETPKALDEEELYVQRLLFRRSKKGEDVQEQLENLKLFRIMFNEILAHEIGESVYANNQTVQKKWNELVAQIPGDISLKDRVKYFLTDYATKAPNEDFADTFALYLLFGDQFKQQCTHPTLQEKYQFMSILFQGKEFPDQFGGASMYTVSNPADRDLETEVRLGILKDMYLLDLDREFEGRMNAGLVALSYEEAEEIIAEAEENGESISQEEGVRRLREQKFQATQEMIDEKSQRKWVYAQIRQKTYKALLSPSIDIGKFELEYDEFCRVMIDGDKKAAAAILHNVNVQKRPAAKIVKDLLPFYTGARDIIEERMIRKEDLESETDLKGMLDEVIKYVEKEKNE